MIWGIGMSTLTLFKLSMLTSKTQPFLKRRICYQTHSKEIFTAHNIHSTQYSQKLTVSPSGLTLFSLSWVPLPVLLTQPSTSVQLVSFPLLPYADLLHTRVNSGSDIYLNHRHKEAWFCLTWLCLFASSSLCPRRAICSNRLALSASTASFSCFTREDSVLNLDSICCSRVASLANCSFSSLALTRDASSSTSIYT